VAWGLWPAEAVLDATQALILGHHSTTI